ncbi:MAG: agmatine deiminase family protein, partial [Acidobacteria bacterium]|nr:agmatine deiminase family protein [Acidobacteriota bacterium]
MPAEWSPHAGTWLSWPHNRESWPGKFETVEPVMVQAVAALAPGEAVHINVLDAAHERHVRGLLSSVSGSVRYHRFPTNDAWCRDHGAVFVTRVGQAPLAAVERVLVAAFRSAPLDVFRAACPEVATAATWREAQRVWLLQRLFL